MQYELLAAVDVGSNSFYLQIGRAAGERIEALESLREPVGLAAGLTADGELDYSTQSRALEALARFGERLRGFPPHAVRAVGTHALRVAKNAAQFLEAAEAALGFPIEVLDGAQEARLTYLGVAHSLPASSQRRLVVDIGGGSTEFIVGTGFDPMLIESLPLGCIGYSRRYFPDGRVEAASMNAAVVAAHEALQGIADTFRTAGWQEAVASSGSARAIAGVLQGFGWADGTLTVAGLARLSEHLIESGELARARLTGLHADQQAILPGALAIMIALFRSFGVGEMRVTDAALRQGVLYDLLGRLGRREPQGGTRTRVA